MIEKSKKLIVFENKMREKESGVGEKGDKVVGVGRRKILTDIEGLWR